MLSPMLIHPLSEFRGVSGTALCCDITWPVSGPLPGTERNRNHSVSPVVVHSSGPNPNSTASTLMLTLMPAVAQSLCDASCYLYRLEGRKGHGAEVHGGIEGDKGGRFRVGWKLLEGFLVKTEPFCRFHRYPIDLNQTMLC